MVSGKKESDEKMAWSHPDDAYCVRVQTIVNTIRVECGATWVTGLLPQTQGVFQ